MAFSGSRMGSPASSPSSPPSSVGWVAWGANPNDDVGAAVAPPKVVVLVVGKALKMLPLPPDPKEDGIDEEAKLFEPVKLNFKAGVAPTAAAVPLAAVGAAGKLKAVEVENNGAAAGALLEGASDVGAAVVVVVVGTAAVPKAGGAEAKKLGLLLLLSVVLVLVVVVVVVVTGLDDWNKLDPNDLEASALKLIGTGFGGAMTCPSEREGVTPAAMVGFTGAALLSDSEGESGMKLSLVTSIPYLATSAS